MKKSLFIVLFAAMGLGAIAQVEQGRIMVGAGVNFGGSTNETLDTLGQVPKSTTSNHLNLQLRGGYFLSDNFLLGVNFGIGNSTTENITQSFGTTPTKGLKVDKSNSINFGVFARMYKMIGDSKFALFAEGGLGYSSGKTSSNNDFTSGSTTTNLAKTTGEFNSTSVYLRPGLTYFVTNTIAVETSFGNWGYNMSKNTDFDDKGRATNETRSNGFTGISSVNLSSIWLGINFYFGGSGGSSSSSATTNP